MFPLTVIGQRQLIPLGALCSIDPHLVYHTVVAGMSAAVEACNGAQTSRFFRQLQRSLADASLLGIVCYNHSTQKDLSSVAQESHKLNLPIHSALWSHDCTPVSTSQLKQIRMLLDVWQRNRDDVASNELDTLASLPGSKLGCLSHLSRAEIFDKTEDLLTADALRLEIDLSLTMGLIHSVFTSFQVASFLGAIYPYFCDWIVLAKLLAAQPLPPA
ncbi:hypothetical protein WJX84_007026 [Apatococcus fuscideae]|uniref:Uncharacterized protein n=1 Tax=Apatococcus fuscideae TaxID=2026836 RepID=A0AAW1S3L2_9CHLO